MNTEKKYKHREKVQTKAVDTELIVHVSFFLASPSPVQGLKAEAVLGTTPTVAIPTHTHIH